MDTTSKKVSFVAKPEPVRGLRKKKNETDYEPFTIHDLSMAVPRSHHTRTSGPRSISGINTEDFRTSSQTHIAGQIDIESGTTWLLSSVRHNREGYAKSEEVIDLLDGIGVYNGADFIQYLGFNPYGEVNLSDLMAAFNDVLIKPSIPEPVLTAALFCNQQEVKHLKSLLDHSVDENKKLKQDLSEANARNALFAIEIDERHIQLDKSWESKLLLVDKKYQEQIKELKTEMDKLRISGAAEVSRLNAELEEAHNKAAHEEQELKERLASSQKEIAKKDKAVANSSEQLLLLSKQNENLKKDLQHKLQLLESPEDYKSQVIQLKQALAKANKENLKLKDYNDELVSDLEKAQQRIILENRKNDAATNRLSSIELSQLDNDSLTTDDSAELKISKKQIMSAAIQPLDYQYKMRPSLSKELSQCENEEIIEQRLKEIEDRYKMALNILEEKHNSEMRSMLDNFDQEKKSLINEIKKKDETQTSKHFNDIQTSFAQEKFDLIQKCHSEKNYLNHLHEQEIKMLQKSLQEAELNIEDNNKMRSLIHHLEAQLARCHSDIQNLENQKSNFGIQLWQKEMALKSDFDEERKNLAKQFSLELEQQKIRHKQELDELLLGGAEMLTGKLKDDFQQIVRENTEKEVRQSQTVILNQLQRDRSKLTTTLEQEKMYIYEKFGNERKALVEKYEIQIAALHNELDQVYSQLGAEKQRLTEISLKNTEESVASDKAVQNLRKKMEGELVIELTRMKESFESEKRELASQKTELEEKLTEVHRLLAIERKRTLEINILKETLKNLRIEKAKMEKVVDEMKEKLYQQKSVEHADIEIRLKAIRDEGESKGRMEGLTQGREEGLAQGRKEGYEKGFNEGKNEGQKAGFIQGKNDVNAASCKSLEDMKELVDSLKHEKIILNNELRQEKEKSKTLIQQLQDMNQLKASYESLIEEKHVLENKYTETLAALVEKHQAEKVSLLKEIQKLEAKSISMQSDMQAIEFHIGAVHQELQSAKETFNQEVRQTDSESDADLSEDPEDLKEQIKQLNMRLKNTLTVQHDLENLKKDYEALLLDKSELEKTVRNLKSDISGEDNIKSRLQSAEIKSLNEENQKMNALLNQTSDQKHLKDEASNGMFFKRFSFQTRLMSFNKLVKVSTSMALAQSKFVRELESMKQKAKSMVEVESYTKLQIRLVEHQRLVITLQDALREREAIVDKVLKETEVQMWQITQNMQTQVKDIQGKLDSTQEELTKYKKKYKQMCTQSGQRILVLKDLYVENSDLMKTLADREEKRRYSEQQCRKLNGKCENYKKIIDRVCESLSR